MIESSEAFQVLCQLDSNSPNGRYAVYFEDDGRTGWCYAFDRQIAEDKIQCALHVYNAEDFSARHTPQKAQIIWSSDETKAGVLLNGHPYAVFEFTTRQGRCRSGLGVPQPGWQNDHDWDPNVVRFFE